ncbi:MAG: hypothetical protein ABI137_10030 [Antricoccus sp.]
MWVSIGLVLIVLFTMWITWTAARIDRLNARCDAGWVSLDAQLVRRAAALGAVVDERAADAVVPNAKGVRSTIETALTVNRDARAAVENVISATIAELYGGAESELPAGLVDACLRVRVARTFYNDAVRANRTLREQQLPRLLKLGSKTHRPAYFDIEDTAGTPLVRDLTTP